MGEKFRNQKAKGKAENRRERQWVRRLLAWLRVRR